MHKLLGSQDVRVNAAGRYPGHEAVLHRSAAVSLILVLDDRATEHDLLSTVLTYATRGDHSCGQRGTRLRSGSRGADGDRPVRP
jgi:hypothetical protein